VMSKPELVISAALGVVLAGVTGALVNELHNGWGWWAGAVLALVLAAAHSGWAAIRSATSEASKPSQINVGDRDVYATQNGDLRIGPQVHREDAG
jgi:hypothetical protein